MHASIQLLFAGCLLVPMLAGFAVGADSNGEPPLYPFVRDGKWGYIDEEGAWVIEPRFDRCHTIFEGDRVSARLGERWGIIDRSGNWIVEPMFSRMLLNPDEPFQVVVIDGKRGVMGRDGALVLPVEHDEIRLSMDHAWVRTGGRIGSFGLDGRWLHEPSIDWPPERELPFPTDDGTIAWYKSGNRWGLISKEGRILCEPRFREYVMGRHDSEEWIHPDGLDFENHRAWVIEGDDYVLIDNEGVELARHRFTGIRKWSEKWFVFTGEDGVQGLVSRDGEILAGLEFHFIHPLTDERATISKKIEKEKPDGGIGHVWKYGYIDADGRIVVPIGAFHGAGTRSGGGRLELDAFSDGLAPVWRNNPEMVERMRHDPCAGYINRDGEIVIPLIHYQSMPFSEGLGAVRERIPRDGTTAQAGLWGYVDETGALAIPYRFGWASPFVRDRAWVLEAGARWDEARWAMIDRTGKVLTDFAYNPPEKYSKWEHERDGSIARSRWRGDFAVINQGDFRNGLATADGKVVVEPVYNHIREFHDGLAVAVDSRQVDERGNVKILHLILTAEGEALAKGIYARIGDYQSGSAWAARVVDDGNRTSQMLLWTLLDTSARELSEAKFIRPWWVRTPYSPEHQEGQPVFVGELAAVAVFGGLRQSGASSFPMADGWGYINRAGKIVAWDDQPPFN